jgi:hypothetical protein
MASAKPLAKRVLASETGADEIKRGDPIDLVLPVLLPKQFALE